MPESFRRAENDVRQHISAAHRSSWTAEAALEILWAGTAPFTEFHRSQAVRSEHVPSICWLWWWTESSGESLGMLVRALRYHSSSDGLRSVHVGAAERESLTSLFEIGAKYHIPVVYLIFGAIDAELSSSVTSVIPALELRRYVQMDAVPATEHVAARAVPLADVVADDGSTLLTRQIAERLLAASIEGGDVARSRSLDEWRRHRPDSRLPGVPVNRVGDFGISYERHFFQGLRSKLPRYVEERRVELSAAVGGIAITRTGAIWERV
ncbi:hypothetical protein [Pseudonocardia sp. DSM 110487]|uniref:hypothetical protein n=1 Tax=Pseudonocardia sp. DSM 110487 TaxID=2865833 RepID=UPI002105B332|nr:hypothetical protein [Pseudonocardia sp. DSM 110487]